MRKSGGGEEEGKREGKGMQTSLFIVYTPKSLGSGMAHGRLEVAGWSGSCVAPVGVVGCVAPECWLTCERTRGWFHAQSPFILHPQPPWSVWRTPALSLPFNRRPICDQSSILAAKSDTSLSRRTRYLCCMGLRLKLINPIASLSL